MRSPRTLRRSWPMRAAALLVMTVAAVLFAISACSDESEGDGSTEQSESEPTTEQAASQPDSEPTAAPTEPVAPDPTVTPRQSGDDEATQESDPTQAPDPTATPEPTPTPEPLDLPSAAFLGDMTHMYQTMNNCSAASVCMLLSHYGVVLDQEQLRPVMRPNDSTKHGKFDYIIGYLREQGFRAEMMHGGDVQTLKAFLAHDIPVIVQQWLELEEDPIGHYRVVRGYDDETGVFRVNDSMTGNDVRYSYEQFNQMWRAFSYRFIPVYPPEQEEIVGRILGEEQDLTVNRQRTAERIESELEERPEDAELWYSLGTNLHDLGRDEEAVEAYEQARSLGLPRRMLWYVYWPAAAYNNIGQHQQAIEIADAEIASAGTFGEMRYERARAYEALGQTDAAIAEYRQALVDDPKLTEAEEALQRLGAQ